MNTGRSCAQILKSFCNDIRKDQIMTQHCIRGTCRILVTQVVVTSKLTCLTRCVNLLSLPMRFNKLCRPQTSSIFFTNSLRLSVCLFDFGFKFFTSELWIFPWTSQLLFIQHQGVKCGEARTDFKVAQLSIT